MTKYLNGSESQQNKDSQVLNNQYKWELNSNSIRDRNKVKGPQNAGHNSTHNQDH